MKKININSVLTRDERKEIDDLKDKLRSRLPDYVRMYAKADRKAGRGMFTCMLCGSGTHSKNGSGAFHLKADGEHWFCHVCGEGGDIFKLYALKNGLDMKEDFIQIVVGLAQELREKVSDGLIAYVEDRESRSEKDEEKKDDADKDDDCLITFRQGDKAITWTIPSPGDSTDDESDDEELVVEEDPFPSVEPEETEPIGDYTSERIRKIEEYASRMKGSRAEELCKKRGLSDGMIERFKLGYNADRYVTDHKRSYETLVIPYPGTDYYTERLIGLDSKGKYQNQSGSEPVFIINDNHDSLSFFITEGQIDAISCRQAGAKNVIASHYPSKIADLIDSGFQINKVVIVADRDPEEKRGDDGFTPGERHAQKIKSVLDERSIPSVIVFPPEGYKDANDLLVEDQKKLKEFLNFSVKTLSDLLKSEEKSKPEKLEKFKPVNVAEYLSGDSFENDIQYFKKYKDRKTGFENIDEYLTLYPGLACLTGATSLGKTSFCAQLADQLVEKGEAVLYFSLEQLPIEIVPKSLARSYYLSGGSNLTNISIKNGAFDDDLLRIRKEYAKRAERFTIVSCDFTVSADMIVEYVENYIKERNVLPVVIVDYLQIISAPEGSRMDDRERIDDAVKKLKKLSKDNELFVLMISNMARASYREKIGEDSFKESGLIEYTCDYLFGLQLAILEDETFFRKTGSRGGERETAKSEKQEKIDEASKAIPKEIVFKSMKNRNGKKVFQAFFRYQPEYDYFEVDYSSPHDPNNQIRLEPKKGGGYNLILE